MVFTGDADGQDLCTMADNLAGTNINSFPLQQKAMYANLAMRQLLSIAFNLYGGWVYDDTNNSGAPEATVNLVSGTQVYPFPTAQAIFEMEYQDSAGNWNPIYPITLEEIVSTHLAETAFMNTPGYPIFYRAVKNGVKLYPAPNYNATGGLKAHILRDITSFTSATTSTEPGFDSSQHYGIAFFMAKTYGQINSLTNLSQLKQMWNGTLETASRGGQEGGFVKQFKDFYRQKFMQEYPQRLRKPYNVVQQYL